MQNSTLVYGVTYHGSTPESLKGLENSYDKHISAKRLREHLRWYQNHFNVLSLGETLQRIREGRPLPEKTLFIVFHDGYRGNYEVAFPILKEYDLRASFFLTTSFIGSEERYWVDILDAALKHTQKEKVSVKRSSDEVILGLKTQADRLAASLQLRKHLKDTSLEQFNSFFSTIICNLGFSSSSQVPLLGNHESFMNWDMVREMSEAGMDIGSHSHRHLICARQNEAVVTEEMETSKKIIEREVKKSCDLFCYPNGNYPADGNDATDRIAHNLGYKNVLYMVGPFNLLNKKSFRLTGISYGETSGKVEMSRSLTDARYTKKKLLGLRIWPWDEDRLDI